MKDLLIIYGLFICSLFIYVEFILPNIIFNPIVEYTREGCIDGHTGEIIQCSDELKQEGRSINLGNAPSSVPDARGVFFEEGDGPLTIPLVEDSAALVLINEDIRNFTSECKTPEKLFYTLDKDFEITGALCAGEKFDMKLLDYK